MFPRIPLVNGGIFGFVEMWGFSLFWLYWRETVQPVLCSVSRCPANCMRSIEKHFAVLRLLRIAKVFEVSTDFLLGGGKSTRPIGQILILKNWACRYRLRGTCTPEKPMRRSSTACWKARALQGQPFPPERSNCSHTFRGVIQLRLPSALQRYNILDFPGESRVPRNRRFLWILPVKGEHYPL